VGHVPGEKNIFADALSRRFRVPHAALLHRSLTPLPHFSLGGVFTPLLARLSMLLSAHPSRMTRAAHIALECITGVASAMHSVSLPTPPAMSPSTS
jgi:hypothetical protein